MKFIYILLCLLGTILPYWLFFPFLAQNGLDLPLFVREMFSTPIAAFFSMDVLLASMALWTFIYVETRKHKIKFWWLSIIANLLVGVSLGLPLFLLLQEIAMEKENPTA